MTQVLFETACVTPPRTTQAAVVTAVAHPAPRSRDWIVEVAGKLARREGRDDMTRETEITRLCREAALRFADAPIQAFVPLLVERIVGDRIRRERSQNRSTGVATDHSAQRQSCRPASP
ncbi:three-helix bundle dimerization domain-containing protein [Mycobacterium sp. PDNC021]|uniref:three-helix bundle dimerization domain-containing protein n=1 Tax=Mycobacterium sp. PDNC021 TaxID=3391399 RepID=UPI003AAB4641